MRSVKNETKAADFSEEYIAQLFDDASRHNLQVIKFLALIMTMNPKAAEKFNLYERFAQLLKELRIEHSDRLSALQFVSQQVSADSTEEQAVSINETLKEFIAIGDPVAHQTQMQFSAPSLDFNLLRHLDNFIKTLAHNENTRRLHNLRIYLVRQLQNPALANLGMLSPVVIAMLGLDLGIIKEANNDHKKIQELVNTIGMPFADPNTSLAHVYIAIQWVGSLREAMRLAAKYGDSSGQHFYQQCLAYARFCFKKAEYLAMGFDRCQAMMVSQNEDMLQFDVALCSLTKTLIECFPDRSLDIREQILNSARMTVALPAALTMLFEDIQKTFEWKAETKIIRHLKRVLAAITEFECDSYGVLIANHIAIEIFSLLRNELENNKPMYAEALQRYCDWLNRALGTANSEKENTMWSPRRRDSFTASIGEKTHDPESFELLEVLSNSSDFHF